MVHLIIFQAIARAHRIGQKEEVKIFRLVASCSVDEDIIQRAKNKMVLDHLVIQNMDTTGKTVIAGGKNKKAEDTFDKDELQTIIKFGAADLFKDNDDNEETEKEVDLDAILEKAEVKEEEEAPQSEANKELLGAFKCTNIILEELDEEEDEREREKEKARLEEIESKKKLELGWDAIIPENMREKTKVVRMHEGLELAR